MPSVALYGIALAWSCEGLAVDPLARLLAGLDLPPHAGPAALRLVIRRAPASAAVDPGGGGLAPSFFHGIVQAYRDEDGFLLWDRASRIRVPDGDAILDCALAAPEDEPIPGSTEVLLHLALLLSLRRAGLFHLHAAALVHPSGTGVLVVGGSGAGKTTTTLALLEAGYAYLGDDCLFLRRTADGRLEALGFPREFHLGPATLAMFPRLAALAGARTGRGEKRPVDARRAYPGRERAALALEPGRLVAVFPVVTGGAATEVRMISKAEAFGGLLGSSAALVLEGVARREENLALLRALLEGARCVELGLGADALADPSGVIATALAG